MKRLILHLFFLCSIGMFSQELALSEHDGMSSRSNKLTPSVENSSSDFVRHLDGLTDKKLARYLKKDGVAEKLIEKGNEYFDQMWYAESARIFDIVLEKTEAKHTLSLLSKAGDSHYYIGNLEKSYKWYNEIYQSYQDNMQEETFFKYTQTLKGTGKYRRAAALTKILRQKRDEPLNELEKIDNSTWKGAYTVKIKNLGINSPYSDFSPMFHNGSDIVYSSAKDSSILITRKYRWTNQPFLDLYVSKRKNDEGDLSSPKKFSKTINTKYHEASMAFSPDQKTIYFTRNNYGKRLKRGKNGINHLKIYRSRFVGGEWTKAEELPFNSEDYSTGHPAVSKDGTKMYFVSDRPGGYGETDIYMVDIYENGTFSEPQNLGRTVNTTAKEMFPYIAENSLYFSSNRPLGFGGLDVYKSDGTDGQFSVGSNMGQPINSNRDDFSYIIDDKGLQGYFASNRKGGKGDDDIYSFAYTLNLNTISGSVADLATRQPIPNANISLIGKDDSVLNTTASDSTGNYTFKYLNPSTDYVVAANKEGYASNSLSVRTKDNEDVSVSHLLKEIEEKAIVEVFEPKDVLFNFDSFEITSKSARELDKLVTVLKDNKGLSLKIASHTDAIGPKAYNKYLSEKRAKSTKAYLISQGIDESRIVSAIGYGEERLLNDCSDGHPCVPAQHHLNRRSELILISD
ncbi:OmpA family protein [Muricauda sp. 334s03]|uniref:OmpA family protein n=1 Tax=Flagellimonas yonaguniensis TaxID=3031325 RepID=A0ABT5XUG0_9FLAO|nr:OmpA family protein [[Muricauda] yonaguniensis]MDF0714790.1 OmpA family protein [[Muricauda] yonaguniensis]